MEPLISTENTLHLFVTIPFELDDSVLTFLQDKDFLRCSCVCSIWLKNGGLKTRRKAALIRAHKIFIEAVHDEMFGFEWPIMGLMLKHGYPLMRLPVLNLSRSHRFTDYVHFLTPDELPAPVCRFVDAYRRPGLAFRLRETESDLPDTEANLVGVYQHFVNPHHEVPPCMAENKHEPLNNLLFAVYEPENDPEHMRGTRQTVTLTSPFKKSQRILAYVDRLLGGCDADYILC